ncbi:cytochrome c biogenesis protein CcdA [Limibacter armeniacum]|uniref:protein-disulfide reductase DsbD family protein n=1 Tax=Limibacter armeniacum TaxID=466084 RepID=UPI002FE6711A
MKKSILLLVLALVGSTPAFATSIVSEMNDWVGQQLSADNNSILSYLFLLIGGLAASLLPCVYPLYPITINILKARGNSDIKTLHPIVYFLGIVSMYFAFGIIAGTTGGAFNEVLRYPITNLLIATVLILLGLSSAELLFISIFSGSSGDSTQKGALGTYLMGLSAGLLSSACVGPVVVSILIGIASNTTSISLESVLGASLKLFVFGFGVGTPFLLIGVLGAKLPKAGKWMKYVQYAFAALIIYFSYNYLEKGLLGYGFEEATVFNIAIGAFILVLAIYHLQKSELFPHQKMRNALFTLAAVVGGLILFRSFAPQTITAQPSIASTEVNVTEQKGNLTWYTDKDAAYDAAKKQGKLVFLDFHGNWCTNCKAFQKLTQQDEGLNEALQNAVLYKIYDTSEEFEKYKKDSRFPELNVGLPFFVITDTDGNMLYKTNDYQKTEEIAMFLSE